MKNVILGIIGVLWGGAILFKFFFMERPAYSNQAYQTGNYAGMAFGGLLF